MKPFYQINTEGQWSKNGQLLSDPKIVQQLFALLIKTEGGIFLVDEPSGKVVVECFDAPIVADDVEISAGETWQAVTRDGYEESFDWKTISLDEWDRFHATSHRGLPISFTRKAHEILFDGFDSFDDESISFSGQTIKCRSWLPTNSEVENSQFWTNTYKTHASSAPPWDLGEVHPAVKDTIYQLKLLKSKILVLGAGGGHDAAHLAKQGHLVTAVDFSSEAILKAKANYPSQEGLSYIEKDVFELPPELNGSFDVVLEHTCFCAINPVRRKDLTNVWRKVLAPGGLLLGVFFVFDRPSGPPFGGTEWEIRERLKKHFDFLYWTRWKNSPKGRDGAELVVVAKKK